MKKVAIILGIILLVIIILIGGLSLYLTDERLRSFVVPELQELTGRDVQVERISYSLFRTFPRFGLIIEGLEVPDPGEEKLASVDRILISMNLLPLLRSELSIHRLEIDRPEFTYIVYEDGTTNLDDILAHLEEDPEMEDEPGELMDIDLSEIVISDASFGMIDYESGTTVHLSDLNISSSLTFTDVLESTMDLTLGSLDVYMDGQRLVSGLGFHLRQTSVLDLEGENLNLVDGQLNLQGLALTLEGNVSDWSGGEPLVDLQIASESDDFGALLDLVPPAYEEYTADLDTGGELDLVVNIRGRISEEEVPAFEARASIVDGFIQHRDVPDRISNINLSARADNDLVTIETFEANAGETRLSASGEIRNPMEDTASFSFSGLVNADLSTAGRYVPLEDFDIEDLSGLIEIRAEAIGNLWTPEESEFDVLVSLADGRIAHAELGRPLEDIVVELRATHEEVRITNATARSSDNYFSATGTVSSPLDYEIATFTASGDVTLDLATVREYYPIDEDTLTMRGMLTLSGSANGRLEDPENASFSMDMELSNGFVDYHEIGQAIEELAANISANESTVTINDARIRSGTNQFSMSGSITDYLEEWASFDLTINGLVALGEINEFYPVEEEFGLVMSGEVDSGARLRGRIDDPEAVRLDGSVVARSVHVDSPDLILPLTELNGTIVFNGDDLSADQITFYLGESDYFVSGNIYGYRALMDEPGESDPARFTGNFRSEHFNADEFLDFEELPEGVEPEPFEAFLPNLSGEFQVVIERMNFFEMEATDVRGTVVMTPDYISSDDAVMEMFDGTMEGSFRWDVFATDHTGITFNGILDKVRVEQLFDTFDLGGRANLAEHVRADFSATTEFYAEFDEYMEMDMMVLRASGDFGMEEARISGHPIQTGIAGVLGVDELNDLSLDSWTALYNIEDGVMRLDDFNITSRDLGLNLHGTQDLISDELDYRAEIVMPGDWAQRVGGAIPSQGADALRRDDGKLVLPMTIRGTSENPRPGLDEERVRELVESYLRDRAQEEGREILEGVLDRFRRN